MVLGDCAGGRVEAEKDTESGVDAVGAPLVQAANNVMPGTRITVNFPKGLCIHTHYSILPTIYAGCQMPQNAAAAFSICLDGKSGSQDSKPYWPPDGCERSDTALGRIGPIHCSANSVYL